jgi:hypothetical protein
LLLELLLDDDDDDDLSFSIASSMFRIARNSTAATALELYSGDRSLEASEEVVDEEAEGDDVTSRSCPFE